MSRLVVYLGWLAFIALAACAPRSVPVTAPPQDTLEEAPQTKGVVSLSRAQAQAALCALYEMRDVDCDRRLTILDERARCGRDQCAKEDVVRLGERAVVLTAVHEASQLATELADGLVRSDGGIELDLDRALGDPVSYLQYRIQQRYWTGLTRTIRPSGAELLRALRDEKQGATAASGPDWCPAPHYTCATKTSEAPLQPVVKLGVEEQTSSREHLYVPASDPMALEIYAPATKSGLVELHSVPSNVTAAWVNRLTQRGEHGLLTLAYDSKHEPEPFVVPGGRFNEMYGWDSFFISWGLLQASEGTLPDADRATQLNLARAMVDHQAYQIVNYGKVLNANRTYYLTRSQPPFFATLLHQVYNTNTTAVGHQAPPLDSSWLTKHLQSALLEYRNVWSAPPRRTELCDADVCLARYASQGSGQPPEVEPDHFAAMYQAHAVSHQHCKAPESTHSTSSNAQNQRFLECVAAMVRAYKEGELADKELDAFFFHDGCVRESGHDTTFRWFVDGQERCADHVTVDLNSLLFRYEVEIAQLYAQLSAPEQVNAWCSRAHARARLVQQYLWNDSKGLFVDYDFVRGQQSSYVAATTLYPLWASVTNPCGATLLSPQQAERLVNTALKQLEAPGGLLATAPASAAQIRKPQALVVRDSGFALETVARQWEAPNGWPPHQMLAWQGLVQHGFDDVAQRLAYRWLHMIATNATNYHGTVPEKFDVVRRSHRVFAEYGNVNTDFAYIAQEGFGWMNASFLVGWQLLTPAQRAKLQRLEPFDAP